MSNEKDDDILDMDVVEEKDGSATVDLPDHIESPTASDDDRDQPNDTDAIREARRNRRHAKKDYIKRTNEEKDQRLSLLQRRNQELEERLSVVERKTHGADLARYDKAIDDEELRLNYAISKMREATDNSDGTAFTKAQEMWYDSRRKVEAMKDYKQRATQNTSQETGAVNPKLMKLANNWMEKNDWYSPDSNDEDTAIAKVVDNRLVAEGWNPENQDYWDELDTRLQKRLPHRYTQSNDEYSRRRPKSVVTGSGRESVSRGGNSFVLEPEQVRAMKDAGFWEDTEKRNRMIKRYAADARNSRS